ncbi:hypothetical protein PIROE2DRAFT_4674 [Piromyces sp. E2]|nr:hypothetical protein PIROE2DRAFT_4674 [Piromyces sp. E2]|eukprot:OUM67733.1 hypothetical protein PIROE2DRAFT_4674 [Piromyces sp. E2]
MADRTLLLNSDRRKRNRNRKVNKLKSGLLIIFLLSFITLLSRYVTEVFLEKNINYFMKSKDGIYGKEEMFIRFMPLYNNGTKGPITINRKLDDGRKFNIYSMMRETNESFESSFYDQEAFKKLKNVVKKDEEYFCEIGLPSEAFEGYYLTCPTHYTIAIDKAAYGRYKSDRTHCIKDYKGEYLANSRIETSKDCGINALGKVKELCEGRTECNLKPNSSFFGSHCENLYKYLHVKYHCVKDKVSY